MSLSYSFSGKSVLITGGGRGIGRQLVQRFYDDGATVFTIEKDPQRIEELRKALPNVTAEAVDISDWDATRKVIESFGPIDHLVNNAGIIVLQPFMEVTKEAATAQLDVNLAAMINISQTFARSLISADRGGSIVNISSIAAKTGSPVGGTVYGATKAGVENLTKTMALELGQHNIRVNSVSPGMVDTPMLSGVPANLPNATEHLEGLFKKLIIKRLIQPNEIADLVMFLLSPLSTMIAGENVVIDAGLMAM